MSWQPDGGWQPDPGFHPDPGWHPASSASGGGPWQPDPGWNPDPGWHPGDSSGGGTNPPSLVPSAFTARDFMARIDRRIFRCRLLRALATFGDTENVAGIFIMQPRELVLVGGAIQSVGMTFECHYVPELANLAEQDPFIVHGYGTYRFLREVLAGGDESGLTIIELGENK